MIIIHPDFAATAQAIMDGMEEATCHQLAFFSVPPPPVGIRWDIQWRWNRDRLLVRIGEGSDDLMEETLEELNAFCGDNPWQRHRNPKFHSINNIKYALECKDRLSRDFPGKEFRIECVRWREVTEPTMFE